MTFPTTVIRKLARTEEVFARTQTFHGLTLHLSGPVDVDAMSVAFDALLRAHPVLAGHLEQRSDGWHQIVADDLLHSGIWVVDGDDARLSQTAGMQLDQSVALVNLRAKLGGGRATLTLYSHHSVADAHNQFCFLEKLLSWYTDVLSTGSVDSVRPEAAPEPLEVVLAERGIRKQQRSGFERFLPAMFAYDLPAPKKSILSDDPALPVHIPANRCRLPRRETLALNSFCRSHQLSLNALVSAVILLSEWRLRKTPNIPIPYIYPVDLRFFLTPPVAVTGCTNPLGLATYLAEIDTNTDVVDLARDITTTFRADLSDGVIQQALLHWNPDELNLGLPNLVLCTDAGEMPAVRTPPNLEVAGFETELYRTSLGGVDLYGIYTFDDELIIEHFTETTEPQRITDMMHSLLCGVPSEYGWIAE
jgi:phenolphthiocerol/phthiocerol/phthiodiolone dimycocerosyl transferase